MHPWCWITGLVACLAVVGCGAGVDVSLGDPANSASPPGATLAGGGGGAVTPALPTAPATGCPVDVLAALAQGIDGVTDPLARGRLQYDLRGLREADGGSQTLRQGMKAQLLADVAALAHSHVLAADRAARLQALAACLRP